MNVHRALGAATMAAAPPSTAPDLAAPSEAATDVAAIVAERNPFRPNRGPAEEEPPPPPERAPRAPLHLRGLLGGPPWTAVVEGLPGVAGAALVRQGDTVAGHWLVRARRDTAVVRSADTTWYLTLSPR